MYIVVAVFSYLIRISDISPLSRKYCSFKSSTDEAEKEKDDIWLYCCSCDKHRSDVVIASGPFINMLYEGTCIITNMTTNHTFNTIFKPKGDTAFKIENFSMAHAWSIDNKISMCRLTKDILIKVMKEKMPGSVAATTNDGHLGHTDTLSSVQVKSKIC